MTGTDDGERFELTYEEARTVLDHQQQVVADIDDKAVRTVRLTAVLLGVFVAASRIAGVESLHPWISLAGVVLLFCSISVGVFTYAESDLYLGPGNDYVNRMAAARVEGWQREYLGSMGYWMASNQDDIEWNGDLLLLTQCLFVLGFGLLSLSFLV